MAATVSGKLPLTITNFRYMYIVLTKSIKSDGHSYPGILQLSFSQASAVSYKNKLTTGL